MTTTITGTTVTFTDGSTWGGANGTLTPDTNSANTATSFNVGYLALANTIFPAGGAGYSSAGNYSWGLNRDRYSTNLFDNAGISPVSPIFVNIANPYNSYLGNQNFYIFSAALSVGPQAAGTWRGRGHAMNTGLYQYYGNFVLLERVA